MPTSKDVKSIASFIYETGILSKTPRSGLWFLGTGQQSVAEHTLRCAFIGYSLCYLQPKANKEKVVLMCLLHDLGEGRTSDLNYVHQKYGRLAEARAVDDLSHTVPFGPEIKAVYTEVEAKQSLEAKLAKDADQLEWLATMREEETKGNIKAKEWAKITYKRLKTAPGKAVGKMLLAVHPDAWWFNAKDAWWVDRIPPVPPKKKKR
jgi:5'-deoxynucleotidase YfbR-like HD superfamily hydrolase